MKRIVFISTGVDLIILLLVGILAKLLNMALVPEMVFYLSIVAMSVRTVIYLIGEIED